MIASFTLLNKRHFWAHRKQCYAKSSSAIRPLTTSITSAYIEKLFIWSIKYGSKFWVKDRYNIWEKLENWKFLSKIEILVYVIIICNVPQFSTGHCSDSSFPPFSQSFWTHDRKRCLVPKHSTRS